MKQEQFAAGIESAADLQADDVLHAAATGVPHAHQNHHGQPSPSRASSHGSGRLRQPGNVWSAHAQSGRMYTARTYRIARFQLGLQLTQFRVCTRTGHSIWSAPALVKLLYKARLKCRWRRWLPPANTSALCIPKCRPKHLRSRQPTVRRHERWREGSSKTRRIHQPQRTRNGETGRCCRLSYSLSAMVCTKSLLSFLVVVFGIEILQTEVLFLLLGPFVVFDFDLRIWVWRSSALDVAAR